MGTSGSKLVQKATEEPTVQETGSIPSTPILTPKVFRENIEKESLDPRSPSKHFARTPIELLSAAANKLEELTIETDNSDRLAVETPMKRHLILGIDPRSPTLELQRTPIVVSASPDKKLPSKIRNKNLERIKNSALLNTPKTVPPMLLDSSPLTHKIKSDAYKRKSFVLLETNIDFTETDLDTVIKEKYLGNSLQNLSLSEEPSLCEIIDPRSPTADFLRTPIQVCKKTEPVVDNLDSENVELVKEHPVQNVGSNNEDVKECIEVQTSGEVSVNIEESNAITSQSEEDNFINNFVPKGEDSIETERSTCNQTLAITDINHVEDNMPFQSEETNILPDTNLQLEYEETCETNIYDSPCNPVTPISPTQEEQLQLVPKSAPVSPPNVTTVTPQKSKSQPVTPPLIDLTADVKELDKKLTNLIYEDEDLVVCPRVVKIKDQCRPPLGPRNGTDNKKCTPKLKVSDKPRKAEYAVSKIPLFKEKKIKVQCENTPPRGMRGVKSKKSHWDSKDDTLVI